MKKVLKLLTCLALVVTISLPIAQITKAASASTSIAVSASSINVGEQVTVTCRFSSSDQMMVTEFYVQYDSSVLELVSGAEGGGGNAYVLAATSATPVTSYSTDIVFKAVAQGSSAITIAKPVALDMSQQDMDVTGSSTTITVGGGAATGSSTNTLSALSVSAVNNAGTATQLKLSPAFSAGTTTYSTAAPSDTVKLSISATTSDGNATTSVRYANMDPGDNKTYIDVTAENGEVLTYVIQTKVDDAAYAASNTGEEETTTQHSKLQTPH